MYEIKYENGKTQILLDGVVILSAEHEVINEANRQALKNLVWGANVFFDAPVADEQEEQA